VVGDRRLAQADGSGQLADAGFAVLMHGDYRDQLEPDGIGQSLEDAREVGGLAGGNRLAQQRCAVLVSQR